jgi:hypothetical protein
MRGLTKRREEKQKYWVILPEMSYLKLILAELDRAKTLFFNNISHEFRYFYPLNCAEIPPEHPLPSCLDPWRTL